MLEKRRVKSTPLCYLTRGWKNLNRISFQTSISSKTSGRIFIYSVIQHLKHLGGFFSWLFSYTTKYGLIFSNRGVVHLQNVCFSLMLTVISLTEIAAV